MSKFAYYGGGEIYAVFIWRWWVEVKTPRCRKYFSERNGYDVPLFEFSGYRLFIVAAN